jgi:hypothetical protein
MPRPVITAADILEKRRREDGGADLLVQVTLQAGDVHWLAVRQADAMLTATHTVEGHGRRFFVTVPARRTLKASLADLLTGSGDHRNRKSDWEEGAVRATVTIPFANSHIDPIGPRCPSGGWVAGPPDNLC